MWNHKNRRTFLFFSYQKIKYNYQINYNQSIPYIPFPKTFFPRNQKLQIEGKNQKNRKKKRKKVPHKVQKVQREGPLERWRVKWFSLFVNFLRHTLHDRAAHRPQKTTLFLFSFFISSFILFFCSIRFFSACGGFRTAIACSVMQGTQF